LKGRLSDAYVGSQGQTSKGSGGTLEASGLLAELSETVEFKKRNGEEAEASSPFAENRAIYWSAERASQATSVAGAAPPVGSTWITPDSSLQNVRLPVAFTLRGTAPVT
jgi:hypothetical protein